MTELIVHELRDTFRSVPFPVALLRIVSAVILAGVIGAEREWRRKPAGLRSHAPRQPGHRRNRDGGVPRHG